MFVGGLPVPGEQLGARLTVGIEGSFGNLHYPLLAFGTSSAVTGPEAPAEPSLTKDLLTRGFRRACNSDYADIALKAHAADGSVLCPASNDGLVSLFIDDTWSGLNALTQETAKRPSGSKRPEPERSHSSAVTTFGYPGQASMRRQLPIVGHGDGEDPYCLALRTQDSTLAVLPLLGSQGPRLGADGDWGV